MPRLKLDLKITCAYGVSDLPPVLIKMNLLVFLLFLFNSSVLVHSASLNDSTDPLVKDCFEDSFLQVADGLLMLSRSSGQHDTVFKRLREGESLTDFVAPQLLSPELKRRKEHLKTENQLEKSQPVETTQTVFREIEPEARLPSPLSSRSREEHHAPATQNTRIPPEHQQYQQQSASFQLAPHHQASYYQPTAPAVSVTRSVPVASPFEAVYDHLVDLSTRSKPRCFGVFSGFPHNLIVPEFAQIHHIFNFFNLIKDFNLRLQQASYTIIPTQISNPIKVVQNVAGAPVIFTRFSYEILVNKLLQLHHVLCDDRVFENILAIQFDFDQYLDVSVTIIFIDYYGSFARNRAFFRHALADFRA